MCEVMKLFQKLLATPAIISIATGFTANASEVNTNDLDSYSSSPDITSVRDFNNLVPGDWAYESLKDLTSQTKCLPTSYISNLSSGSSITRIEAAAVLNSCIKNGNLIVSGEGINNKALINRLTNELGKEIGILKGRVDGLEVRINGMEAGEFSSTTSMSGTAAFLIGAADGPSNVTHQTMAEYFYEIDLDTSFTGDDNLNVEIETGNASGANGSPGTVLDFGAANADVLKVSELSYTFPIGEWTLSFGDAMDASTNFPNACAISNVVDALGDCGAGNSVALEGDISFSAGREFGDGWSLGVGISSNTGSTTRGMFSDQGDDYYGLALGYDAENYGVSVAYSMVESTAITGGDNASAYDFDDVQTDTTYYGIVGYWSPEGLPTISGGIETGNPDGDAADTTQWSMGLSSELGEGTIALTVGTNGSISDGAEEIYAYDISYSYPINDSMSITPFAYITEATGTTDDTTGVGASISFSF